MTKTEMKKLEAQAAAAKKAATQKMKDIKKVAQLKTAIELNSNENFLVARVQAEVKRDTSAKLANLNTACETIVTEMPIYNSKTREDRKWKPSRQYGLGNQIAALTGLLSGMQYAAMDHKAQMLALTGLDDDIIEETMEAFGSPAYYSRNYDLVVEEVPYNLEAIHSNIALVENALGVTIDKSKLTRAVLDNRFAKAQALAERNAAEARATGELGQQTIAID